MVGEVTHALAYGNAFVRQKAGGTDRICIGADSQHDRLLMRLSETLKAPFQLLYVLHTTRTGAELGRYESPELNINEVRRFLDQFGRFIAEDARHDLWVHSHRDNATIVLDRHNLIYAYGPLERFERELLAAGIRLGTRHDIPDPHVHHYHAAWDDFERSILAAFQWTLKPLRDSDIQYPRN